MKIYILATSSIRRNLFLLNISNFQFFVFFSHLDLIILTYTFFRVRAFIISLRMILNRELFNVSRLSRSILHLTRHNYSIFQMLYISIMISLMSFTRFFVLSFIFLIFFNWFSRKSFNRIYFFVIFDILFQSIFERAAINSYMTVISIYTTFIAKRSSIKKKIISKTRLTKKNSNLNCWELKINREFNFIDYYSFINYCSLDLRKTVLKTRFAKKKYKFKLLRVKN